MPRGEQVMITYGKGFSWMAMQERKVRKFKTT